jgi:hypothetical protein
LLNDIFAATHSHRSVLAKALKLQGTYLFPIASSVFRLVFYPSYVGIASLYFQTLFSHIFVVFRLSLLQPFSKAFSCTDRRIRRFGWKTRTTYAKRNSLSTTFCSRAYIVWIMVMPLRYG